MTSTVADFKALLTRFNIPHKAVTIFSAEIGDAETNDMSLFFNDGSGRPWLNLPVKIEVAYPLANSCDDNRVRLETNLVIDPSYRQGQADFQIYYQPDALECTKFLGETGDDLRHLITLLSTGMVTCQVEGKPELWVWLRLYLPGKLPVDNEKAQDA